MRVSENSGRNIPGNARFDGVLPVNDEADVGKVESRVECAGGDDSLDLAVAGAVANAAGRPMRQDRGHGSAHPGRLPALKAQE